MLVHGQIYNLDPGDPAQRLSLARHLGGKTLAHGEALTDFEARAAAEAAIKHLEYPAA